MNRLYVIAIFALLSLWQSTFAQENFIEEAEFVAACTKAADFSTKRQRRITAVEETRIGGNIIGINRYVEEYLPPERARFMDIISSGEKSVTNEVMFIGSAAYSRNGKDPWIQWRGIPVRVPNPKMLPPTEWLDEYQRAFKSSQVFLGDQVLRLVSGETKRTVHGIVYTEQYRVWISLDGFIVKSEYVETQKVSDLRVTFITANWEYEPKDLRIRAPIK
jgi:hypothetical protein